MLSPQRKVLIKLFISQGDDFLFVIFLSACCEPIKVEVV